MTDDVDGVRQAVGQQFAVDGVFKNYGKVFDREGFAGPAEAAIVGDADTVTERLTRYAENGATDFAATIYGRTPDEVDATRDVLAALAAT